MTDPTPTAGQPLGDAARLLVEAAQVEALSLGHSFVGTEHLLLALLADPTLADRARERGAPSRDDLRAALAASGMPKAMAAGDAGLSSQARRLLEGAERAAKDAGAIAIDRKAILDRILSGSRGPLGKLLNSEPKPRAREAEPRAQPAPQAKKAAATPPKAREAERKPRESPRRSQEAARTPEAARKPPEPPARSAPVVIRSRRAIPISWRGVLLLLVPLTMILERVVHAPPFAVFVAACLGVMPLASYMGEATEHLSARTGPAIGGLLNATFGNAAELIIAIVALQAGLVDLVKASITGSILGNLLLITGLSFVAGGLSRPVLKFNRTSTGASAGMLALAVVGLVFPALMHHLNPSPMPELRLSEVVAVVLAVTYGFSLLFSLRTHRSLFGGGSHSPGTRPWTPLAAIGVLALATSGVVVQSEILVRSVEQVTATMGLSQVFLGLIVIPIIGNAAEHATAVVVARKGQMDLALHIALGSSTQVALLVAPVLVLVGLVLAEPMNLVFTTLEVVALGLTTIITAIVTLDGESNWFEGVQLLAMFALVAAAAYFI